MQQIPTATREHDMANLTTATYATTAQQHGETMGHANARMLATGVAIGTDRPGSDNYHAFPFLPGEDLTAWELGQRVAYTKDERTPHGG